MGKVLKGTSQALNWGSQKGKDSPYGVRGEYIFTYKNFETHARKALRKKLKACLKSCWGGEYERTTRQHYRPK